MGRQGCRTLGALGVALVVAAATAGTAAGAGPVPPVNVSGATDGVAGACGFIGSRPGIGGLDVATNARGDTIASWLRSDGGANYTVQAAFRPAGGTFGAPQDIGTTTACFALGILGPAPDVAIDDEGGAAIVYTAPGTPSTVVRAAVRPPGGVFGTPVDLSDDSQGAANPRLAMNRNGLAVAVWSWNTGANSVIQSSTRQPGQGFGTVVPLTVAGQQASVPRVAVNDAGAVAAAWVRFDGTTDRAQARVRPAGSGTFAAVQELSAAGAATEDAAAPDVALDPNGNATVVWTKDDGPQVRLQTRTLNPAGVMGAGVEDITDPGVDASTPAVALDPANNAVVVFGLCPVGSSNCAVSSASRPSGGSFGAVQAISAAGDQSFSPRVVVDASGVATAVFSPLTSSDLRVLVTRRPLGGTFGAVAPLSAGGQNVAPAAAIDDQGNVVVAWAHRTGGAGTPYLAQVAAFDVAAPALAAVSVPATGVAGQPIGMAAAATDRWSPVSISWSFGDGTNGAGDAVSHAFGGAGAFTVTATATDAVGNATSADRSVLVSAAPPPPEKRITSKVRVTWGVSGKRIFLLRLSASNVPKGGKLQLRCNGKKCPYKKRGSKKRRSGRITLFKEIKAKKAATKKKRSFRAGQTLQVRITAKGYIGKVVKYKLKKGKIPSGKTLCLPIGKSKPRSRCS
jgi:hypothetical protein